MDSFEKLKTECLQCRKCTLCETRHSVVIGVGSESADLMFIGEGPGEKEDMQGEPFVGPAGQLLDTMLTLIGLNRRNVYIANIVKCRPPMNRDPNPEERNSCIGWLKRQIELVNPKLIVCLGRIAAITLIDDNFKITREHGKWFEINGRKYLATYHPSALLRDISKRPDAFSDFRKIRTTLKEINQLNTENV